MAWENVDYMDEHSIHIIQLFNRNTNEMLIVTQECDEYIEFTHLRVKPEYEDNKLVWFEDAEVITSKPYSEDYEYQPFEDLIEVLLK